MALPLYCVGKVLTYLPMFNGLNLNNIVPNQNNIVVFS